MRPVYGDPVSGEVGDYIAQVDLALAAGQRLFPASGLGLGGIRFEEPSVANAPSDSRLTTGVRAAGDGYNRRLATASGLDEQATAASNQGSSQARAGLAGANGVRQSAATAAATIAPVTGSPAGVKALVSSMDERLAAMQRQIDVTRSENQVLGTRLRQVAMAYRSATGAVGARSMPLAAMTTGGLHEANALGGPYGTIAASHGMPATSTINGTGTVSAAMPSRAGMLSGRLTPDSTPREVASVIVHEALRRGYSPHQTCAILSTAMQESGLRPRAVSPNGLWKSIFQQDSSYRDRDDPNAVIQQFFDRLATKGGPRSPDIWKSIFWLQQRPGDTSPQIAWSLGRQAYLGELQSKLSESVRLFREITT